jgi:hypothetical protein
VISFSADFVSVYGSLFLEKERCVSGLNGSPGKTVCRKRHRGFESLPLRQFTISEFSEVLRTCGAVASPADEAERADFATVCHAPRGEKEMFWFWIRKFEPIFFRKSRIRSGFSCKAIILACLLAFMKFMASSNRLLLFRSKETILSFKTCF